MAWHGMASPQDCVLQGAVAVELDHTVEHRQRLFSYAKGHPLTYT